MQASSPEARRRPELTLLIPVVERHGDLAAIVREYGREIDRLGIRAEFLFVVDRRERRVLPLLETLLRESDREITILTLGGTFGESAAVTVGIERARGELIATVSAYFQVEPVGLGPSLEAVRSGEDVVIGCRSPRVDSPFNRLQSRVFNGLLKLLTGMSFRDVSSGFRVMRREVAQELALYGGLHRFIPILAAQQGYAVREVEIPQRKEDAPTRYYGVAIYLKRLIDLFTVFFLTRFTHRPLRFFGPVGLGVAVAGIAITGYLGVFRLLGLGPIAHRPLLLLGVLLLVLGVQILSIGLIGEIITFTHARSLPAYRIQEVLTSDPEAQADGAAPQELVSGLTTRG